ncbi:DUF2058 domain-containing protein [Oleiagrimonas sp. C23AA]|uniref:DUF2058 domain-containing protein n=1 Tax=Oleiagrimonas sp. C23AA TaxID=2719047 RepID=UPI00142013B1|nr:DUF2058 domain-containing protein [Oleiagrimonas sp. C23AA]NII09855.1 DUF2058 domain-containing protein [Oleiagrimonas sp. C23AA]
MRNALQDQLLKQGLAKKSKVNEVVREKNRQRKQKGKQADAPASDVDGARLQAERAERDRALAAEHKAKAQAREAHAQAVHIINTHQIPLDGEEPYRFTDGSVIRDVRITADLRGQLARGALVICRHGEGYALLPRASADKVREREATLIVVDHGDADAKRSEDDDYYDQFPPVPDDLMW